MNFVAPSLKCFMLLVNPKEPSLHMLEEAAILNTTGIPRLNILKHRIPKNKTWRVITESERWVDDIWYDLQSTRTSSICTQRNEKNIWSCWTDRESRVSSNRRHLEIWDEMTLAFCNGKGEGKKGKEKRKWLSHI